MSDAGENEASRLIDIQAIGRDMQTADVVRLVIVERVGYIGAMQPVEPDIGAAEVVDIHISVCLALSAHLSGSYS